MEDAEEQSQTLSLNNVGEDRWIVLGVGGQGFYCQVAQTFRDRLLF